MAFKQCKQFKVRVSPDSRKYQGLHVGDVVQRKYVDLGHDVYSLLCVQETGVDVIQGKESPYFIGRLLYGNPPQMGELLDFVRITNLFDNSRTGALYLTASDHNAPFIDVLDGIAKDKSLCYPTLGQGLINVPSKEQYTLWGDYCTMQYYDNLEGKYRVARIASTGGNQSPCGLKQTLIDSLEHPEEILISFFIRSSHGGDISVKFGYTNGEKFDGEKHIHIGTEWEYQVALLTIDYPRKYSRSLYLDLSSCFLDEKSWCDIASLNVIRLSSLANLGGACKGRIGNIMGVTDPLYGTLSGYGAYFQNLYASQNVNISGTLTAGDATGMGSTFYVGKIHKNVIPNSMFPFPNKKPEDVTSPSKMGAVYRLTGHELMIVQSAEWSHGHQNSLCCFSVWLRSSHITTIDISQGSQLIGSLKLDDSDRWERHSLTFSVLDSPNDNLTIEFSCAQEVLCSSPQLELGNNPSAYQPTDGTLNYTEDYGAWFNRGGIGGTIQNPLLRFHDDGAIESCDGSFRINPDGTGQFARGKLRWTHDSILLRDFTIKWEDLDTDVQEQLKPRSVTLTGGTLFHFRDDMSAESEPSSIDIVATEYNFISQTSRWEYLSSQGEWRVIANKGVVFHLTSAFDGWEHRDVLTIRYVAQLNGYEYTATHTVFKVYDGEASYIVSVESLNGTVFRNGNLSTQLVAHVYKGADEVTTRLPPENFIWKRVSSDTTMDEIWNSEMHIGPTLDITDEDVWHRAVFNCEVNIV